MGRTIRSKVKAVRSLSAFLLVVLVSFQSHSQTAPTLKVTYSCSSVRLEKVIEHISKATGLYFVYSSDKISLNTPVTFSVKDQPVDQVLSLLGKQLNLSFKIHERHVAVTMNEVPLVHISNLPTQVKVIKDDNESIEDKSATIDLFANKNPEFFSLDSDHEKYLVQLPQDVNGILHPISTKYLSTPTNYLKSNWFMSVGSLVNDYSTGLEFQAGIQKFYAVYAPTWLRGDQFHGAYGAGSSFRLSDNFSLNTAYTFASWKQSQTIGNYFGNGPSYTMTSSIQHHQLKFMLQYSLNRKLSFRAGATFNQMNSVNQYKDNTVTGFLEMPYRHRPDYGKGPDNDFTTFRSTQVPPETTTRTFWVGWEASFSYKINFFRKP